MWLGEEKNGGKQNEGRRFIGRRYIVVDWRKNYRKSWFIKINKETMAIPTRDWRKKNLKNGRKKGKGIKKKRIKKEVKKDKIINWRNVKGKRTT